MYAIFGGIRLRPNSAGHIRFREDALDPAFKIAERLSGNWRELNVEENMPGLVMP